MLKAMILFKKEDLTTSKVLDYHVENDQDLSENLVYTYEKFVWFLILILILNYIVQNYYGNACANFM